MKHEDQRPDVKGCEPVLGAILELSTERVNGMGPGSIPISKIWHYLDRFALPDWWEPVILQADAKLVASLNNESAPKGNKPAAGKRAGGL